ncbi:MAG TPA: glycosyltransferase [Acidimicrobiales bacterium]
MATPSVTVIIPVRNEAERLPACIEAVAAQDLDPERVEVLIVDGGSQDATVDVARDLLQDRRWARAKLLHSAPGDRASNLNVGLADATAPVVIRVDARSRIPMGYLQRCVALLAARPNVAVVGGRQRAVVSGGRAAECGAARALNNRWGMGLARYRSRTTSGPTDTVYLGAFRTAQLRSIGGWRPEFAVNEDFDVNRRMAAFGVIWFEASLTVDYVPRAALGALIRQYWSFGTGKARYWRVSGDRPQGRQMLLLAAPLLGLTLFASTVVLLGAEAGAVLVGIGLLGLAGIEMIGADGPHGGFRAHVAAMASLVCVGGAWLAGVAISTTRRATEEPARSRRRVERAT